MQLPILTNIPDTPFCLEYIPDYKIYIHMHFPTKDACETAKEFLKECVELESFSDNKFYIRIFAPENGITATDYFTIPSNNSQQLYLFFKKNICDAQKELIIFEYQRVCCFFDREKRHLPNLAQRLLVNLPAQQKCIESYYFARLIFENYLCQDVFNYIVFLILRINDLRYFSPKYLSQLIGGIDTKFPSLQDDHQKSLTLFSMWGEKNYKVNIHSVSPRKSAGISILYLDASMQEKPQYARIGISLNGMLDNERNIKNLKLHKFLLERCQLPVSQDLSLIFSSNLLKIRLINNLAPSFEKTKKITLLSAYVLKARDALIFFKKQSLQKI